MHGCAIGGHGLAQGRANPPPKGFALCSFRLLSDAGSAIIRPVSRKAILGTLIFDIGDSRKIAAASPKGQNLLPPWHTARLRRSRGILTGIPAAYATAYDGDLI